MKNSKEKKRKSIKICRTKGKNRIDLDLWRKRSCGCDDRSSWSSRIANVFEKSSKGRRERKKETTRGVDSFVRRGTGSARSSERRQKSAAAKRDRTPWLRGGIPVPREPYARQKRCTRLRSLPHWYHPQYLSCCPDGDAYLHTSPLLYYRFLWTPLIVWIVWNAKNRSNV